MVNFASRFVCFSPFVLKVFQFKKRLFLLPGEGSGLFSCCWRRERIRIAGKIREGGRRKKEEEMRNRCQHNPSDFIILFPSPSSSFAPISLLLFPIVSRNGEVLEQASLRGDERIVKLLLQHGASPRECNALGNSLAENHLNIAEFLIEQGADPNQGVPLKRTIAMKSPRLCLLLIQKGASIGRFVNDLVNLGVEQGSVELLELLLSRQVDLVQNREENLLVATMRNHYELVQFFLRLSRTPPQNV